MPNYESNGVLFKNITAGLNTGGQKINKAPYKYENGNIKNPQTIINAIDIDWNSAEVPGIEGEITSTAVLLHTLGVMNDAINDIINGDTPINEEELRDIQQAIQELQEDVEELQNGSGGQGGGQGGGSSEIPTDLANRLQAIEQRLQNLSGLPTASQFQALQSSVTTLSNKVNGLDNFKHRIIEKEDFDALTSYDPNTLYFIIGEPDGGGSGGGSSSRIDLDSISSLLNVNGVTYKSNEVLLEPGGNYVISGTLRGHIIIDASTKTKAEMDELGDTEITLSEVIINSDQNYAIFYKTPADNKGYKDLIVNIQKNTSNVIYCPNAAPTADDQWATIHSSNNLLIKGCGYLAVCNRGGHGLRGTELDICGTHIYVDCNHDGLHGKHVNFNYGYLYTYNAKDAIGTGENGSINVWGGSFKTINVTDNLFDSNQPGIYNAKISIVGNDTMEGMYPLSADDFPTVFGVDNPGYVVAYSDKTSMMNDSGGRRVNATAGTNNVRKYWINDSTGSVIVITGVLSNPIEINLSGKKDCDIYLQNALIVSPSSLNEPTIYFNPIEESDGKQYGRLKITSVKDTQNAIINTHRTTTFGTASSYEGDAIKSENNIGIEIKNNSHLFVSSEFADGIDGGDIKINDSKGYLIVTDCGQRGMKGNAIVIGPNAVINTSVITSYYTDPEDTLNYQTFDGIAIIKGNCKYVTPGEAVLGDATVKNTGFADIYARNGKHTKGVFGTKNAELNGMIITGTMGAVVEIDMDYSSNILYNSIVTSGSRAKNISSTTSENAFAKNIFKETVE